MALLRPCTTSAGFTAVPERKRRVVMGVLRDRLREAGYEIVVDAKVILVVRRGVESSVYESGKVLLKTTDRGAAETAYSELRGHLEAAWE